MEYERIKDKKYENGKKEREKKERTKKAIKKARGGIKRRVTRHMEERRNIQYIVLQK